MNILHDWHKMYMWPTSSLQLYLEHQLMRELSLGQAPGRLEVLVEVGGLLHRLDDGLVDGLLVSSFGFRKGFLGLGLSLIEEFGFR